MQGATYGLRNTIRRLESLRDGGRGNYDNVALTSIFELIEDRPKGMLDSGIHHAIELNTSDATKATITDV